MKTLRRLRESVSSPNSTRARMNHTARASQQSPSSSVNNYNAKRRSAMKERGKSPLQEEEEQEQEERGKAPLQEEEEEESKKGKRRKVETEDVDLKNIVIIDDDLDSSDDVVAAGFQDLLNSLFKEFHNPHVKTEPGSTDPPLDRTVRKWKKQVRFPFSKTEQGQSSKTQNPKTKLPKTYCKICMARTPLAQTFTINPCNHVFCNSCTINYISSKIQENISAISCPDPDCKAVFLDPVLCMEILPKEVFEKWGLLLCESFVGVDKKFYCPFKDCSALLLHEGDEITNSECPHCNRMFCAKCKVPWHADLSCDEFQNLGKDEKGKEDLDLMLRNLAENNKWQRCPQCKMYVEKIDGCMLMKCRCGFCFCYACATPMDIHIHFCAKCRR